MASITLVILGGTGDLARKKLIPAINSLVKRHVSTLPASHKGTHISHVDVIATGRRELRDHEYLHLMLKPGERLTSGAELHYFQADFTKPDSLAGLPEYLQRIEPENCIGRIFYLATSPEYFEPITRQLSTFNTGEHTGSGARAFSRIMIEKPFGHDLASAKALDKTLTARFGEQNIFRVDHYLAKETVQNILVLRFSNPFFERTWTGEFIDQIRITVDESFGVGERLSYYDGVGALRDMIQNHLLQVASFILMDAPESVEPSQIHAAKARALAHLHYTHTPESIILGQYDTYAQELARAQRPPSKTETFVRLELSSDAPRWKGTKIILKTGKNLKSRSAKIEIDFKKEPCIIYCDINTYPNRLVLNVQPIQDIEFFINTKLPGKDFGIAQVNLNFCPECEFTSNTPEGYEAILEDCIENDKTLFISAKELEEAWTLIDGIQAHMQHAPLIIYPKGSTGPETPDTNHAAQAFPITGLPLQHTSPHEPSPPTHAHQHSL